MHGRDGCGEVARIPRPLSLVLLSLLLTLAGPSSAGALPSSGTIPSGSWFRAVPFQGKAFPVLLSTQGRWLNWRDTYGAPRMRQGEDGVWRQTGTHQGIDIFAEQGAPIVAITAGVVENAGWTFYSGYRVGIRGDDGSYWFYAHLLKELSVGQGARVSAGQVLGRMGSSGYGPEGTSDEFPAHVHLGLKTKGGSWVTLEPLLRELYAFTTTEMRSRVAESQRIAEQARLLRSRAYLGGAPIELLTKAAASRMDASSQVVGSMVHR